MRPAIGRILQALLLTLLLAWGGVLSAAHMTPTADDLARQSSVLMLEGSEASLCASETGAAHPHCPFCHALPRADAPRVPQAEARLVFTLRLSPARHLVPAAAPDRQQAPRAPPALSA